MLGQERVGPQRSIRIDVFAINRVALCGVRRADSRSDLIARRVLRRSSHTQVLSLTPIGGFALSTLIFGDALSADVIISIVLIVAGILVTLRR